MITLVQQIGRFLFTVLLLLTACPAMSLSNPVRSTAELDQGILAVLSHLEKGFVEQAIERNQQLLSQYPDSSVVQLIAADLFNLQALRPVSLDSQQAYSRRLLEILSEIKLRRGHQLPAPGTYLQNILQSGPDTRHIIAVDLSESRLYLLERDTAAEQFRLREHYYISIGQGGRGKLREGDLKTPFGIYTITGFRHDRSLPGLYGSGAFILDFPNGLDQALGIQGSGIWLHGMPKNQWSRPPLDSEGCVVINNEALLHILEQIDIQHTPVILAESLRWTENPQHQAEVLQQLKSAVQEVNIIPERTIHSIFVYPSNFAIHSTEILYQVRILLPESAKAFGNREFQTEYWQLTSRGDWQKLFQTYQ